MSKRIGNVAFIMPEPPVLCSECGTRKETRPYGAGFARICYDCAMKYPFRTSVNTLIKLLGVTPSTARRITRKEHPEWSEE